MNLNYREIDPENYDEVYTFNLLHEYSYRDSAESYIADSEDERKKKTANILEKLKRGDRKYFCLAVFDSERMIAAHFLDRYEIDNQPACHVHGLWVHSDYRKKGIAKKLKEMGENWAREMGCTLMDTNVRVKNEKMISLNKGLGFEVARYNFRKKL